MSPGIIRSESTDKFMREAEDASSNRKLGHCIASRYIDF